MNPWLEIPLEDYEAHMSLTSIAQAQFLADAFDKVVLCFEPKSIAIIGCSGGNGFDRISPALVQRVVGIDINPGFIAATSMRFQSCFRQLDLICQDFVDKRCTFEPVDLVFAGLVFEYVDYRAGLSSIKRFVKPGGYLSVILQLPSEHISAVSPSPYSSLNKLSNLLKFVPVEEFGSYAEGHGFLIRESKQTRLDSGKEFHEFVFQKKIISPNLKRKK